MDTQHLGNIQISLTFDEAIVLFELLKRFNEQEELSTIASGEKSALWNLGCLLEKSFHLPSGLDYDDTLNRARQRLAGD